MGFAQYPAAFREPFAITPSDTVNFSRETHGGIYVGGGENASVVAVLFDGSTVTFSNVPVGTIIPVRAIRVNATGTSATNLVGFV